VALDDRIPPAPPARATDPSGAAYRPSGGAGRAPGPVEAAIDQARPLGDRLAELVARNEQLAVEVGALRERTGHQDATIRRLEAERDRLWAEAARLRADGQTRPVAVRAAAACVDAPAAAQGAQSPASTPAFAPSVAPWRARTSRAVDLDAPTPPPSPVPWWRFWEGRR
jgi:hypothetical protein